jgi:hypothetical protein
MNNDVRRCNEAVEAFGRTKYRAIATNQGCLSVSKEAATEMPSDQPFGSGDGNGGHEA